MSDASSSADGPSPVEPFTEADRGVLARIVAARRDVRKFQSRPVPAAVIRRVLSLAHLAPSVGFMQPWNFILIDDLDLRRRVVASFERTNAAEWAKLTELARQELYGRLKLEGILESPLNIAVTCDRHRDAPFVLGRGPAPEMDLYSTCLAVQNLWLAARAENVGVGWVSILDRPEIEKLLGLPPGVELVAYLCVGYPIEFRAEPMLAEVGWKQRTPLDELIFFNRWGERSASESDET